MRQGRPSLSSAETASAGLSPTLGFPVAEGIKGLPEQPINAVNGPALSPLPLLHSKGVFSILTQGATREAGDSFDDKNNCELI